MERGRGVLSPSRLTDFSYDEVVAKYTSEPDSEQYRGVRVAFCDVIRVKRGDRFYDLFGSTNKDTDSYLPVMLYIAQQVCSAYGLDVEPCILGLYKGAFVAAYDVSSAMQINYNDLKRLKPICELSREFTDNMAFMEDLEDTYKVPSAVDLFLESFIVDALTGFTRRSSAGFNFGLRPVKSSFRLVSMDPIRAGVSSMDETVGVLNQIISERNNMTMASPESIAANTFVISEYYSCMTEAKTRAEKLRKRQAENLMEAQITFQTSCGYTFNGKNVIAVQFLVNNEYPYIRSILNKIYRLGFAPLDAVFDSIDVIPSNIRELCRNLYKIRLSKLRYCVEYRRDRKSSKGAHVCGDSESMVDASSESGLDDDSIPDVNVGLDDLTDDSSDSPDNDVEQSDELTTLFV